MLAKGAEGAQSYPGTTEGQLGVLGQETAGTNSGQAGGVENHNKKAKIDLHGEYMKAWVWNTRSGRC